jgi:hypothetical protein
LVTPDGRIGACSPNFWTFLYDHPGNPKVFIDVTLGTWEPEGYSADHVTFGSRTGAVEEHPRLEEFWRVNDEILELPEAVRLFTGRQPPRRWPWRPLL